MNLFETVDIIAPVTAIVDKEEVAEEPQTPSETMPTESDAPPATEEPSQE